MCYIRLRIAALAVLLAFFAHGARRLRQPLRTRAYRQTLRNHQNVQYYADLEIGGQPIAGIFDTGSFELLVRSTRCSSCVHPTPAYDHLKSTSFMGNGTVKQHVFGSGPCLSMMGYESVKVGPLRATGQTFWEIVNHQISVLDTAKFAAIVGIGPNFAQDSKERTLLMSYGVSEFSVCLQRPSGSDGFLTWGRLDNKLPPEGEDVAKATVIGKLHWVARLSNMTFAVKNVPKSRKNSSTQHVPVNVSEGKGTSRGETEHQDAEEVITDFPRPPVQIPCSESSCAAIFDSGTSLIAGPGIALMQLSQLIPQIAEDCSNLQELPPLLFNVDGHDFELPPEAYVMRVTGALMEANSIWDLLFFKPKIRKLDMCMPAFMQMDMMSQHGPVWILGMPFFRHYHTTFDRVKRELRFAPAGPNCEPLPYRANKTKSLLALARRGLGPMDVEVGAIVPPTLSGQIDFPFTNNGDMEL